jgi:hypothetical protein
MHIGQIVQWKIPSSPTPGSLSGLFFAILDLHCRLRMLLVEPSATAAILHAEDNSSGRQGLVRSIRSSMTGIEIIHCCTTQPLTKVFTVPDERKNWE